MKVTFLSHSGFLVELKRVALLFDDIGGALPDLGGKPLLVFASHRHADHFSPDIFSLENAHFVLSNDIEGYEGEHITRVGPGEMHAPLPGVLVETLPSTDEGVAFLVTVGAQTIFHAGDLNWWHWEGEPDPWNPDMARNFKAYAEPLRGRHLDLAMLPLDPRLEENGFLGPDYFLNLAEVERFFPIHLWRKFAFVEAFLTRHPEYRKKTLLPTADAQVFEL